MEDSRHYDAHAELFAAFKWAEGCGSGGAAGLCLCLCLCLCTIVQGARNTGFESCTACRVYLRQMIGDELIGASNMGFLGL